MIFRLFTKAALIFFITFLAGCGGGGGDDEPTTAIDPPVVGPDPVNPVDPVVPVVPVVPPANVVLLWSLASTWGSGHIPVAGDSVEIPNGVTVVLDIATPALSGLTINGTLEFDDKDVAITSDWIMVTGSLIGGTESAPYSNQAVITLTGDPDVPNAPVTTRGIMVMGGGTLDLHGVAPDVTWTKIDEHISAGASDFLVEDRLGWKEGDHVVLAPTDFYSLDTNEKISEELIITDLNLGANRVGVTPNIAKSRWGKLQYLTSAGMSEIEDPSVLSLIPAATGFTPTVLDERAEVANLTRNIVIQGADDNLWQNEGFGAHVMIMGLSSTVRVDGVEFYRAGQSNRLGRYPFHWHRLSYDDLTWLGDADSSNHYLRNSSIHNSANRCVTIHATNGVLVDNNICFDIRGHGIFFEDAVERRNTVTNNLVLRVRNPESGKALKLHETLGPGGGSSGIWLSNPDNTVTDNVLVDAEGFGLWIALPLSSVGASHQIPMTPYRMKFGNLDGNTMHSNKIRGSMFDLPEQINAGNEDGSLASSVDTSSMYAATKDGTTSASSSNLERFTIKGWSVWKNMDGNMWDRAWWPTFEEIVSADSAGKYFAGAGINGIITRALIVGESLNNANDSPHSSFMGPPAALATYHSAFSMYENIIVNFPIVEDKTSGAFATDDYYLRPVEKGQLRNVNNKLIDSHGGYRSDAKVDENLPFGFAQGLNHFVFAGALLDAQGVWGAESNWSVYDLDFFTHGASCTPIAPLTQNVTSCNGKYYGVNAFVVDKANTPYNDRMAIKATRYNDTNSAVIIDTWDVTQAFEGDLLSTMRHFAAREGGTFLLEFPGLSPTDVSMEISNMQSGADEFVLGIEFHGSSPEVYSSTSPHPGYQSDSHANSTPNSTKHDYQQGTNKQDIIDGAVERYWFDAGNNIVWVKVSSGDIAQKNTPDTGEPVEFTNVSLYNPFVLRVW